MIRESLATSGAPTFGKNGHLNVQKSIFYKTSWPSDATFKWFMTNFCFEPAEQCTEKSLDQVEYIRIAADLLEQYFSELRSLAIDHPEFARALTNRGSEARARLWTLHDIVGLLMRGDDPSMAGQITLRAIALISWLSAKFDELTLTALGDDGSVDTSPSAFH
jgi:hypothetical protein